MAVPDLAIQQFHGNDGAVLAYRELGQGRPLVLLHGYFSTATVNWVRYGHAATLAQLGYRVVMPDLRAHGDSAKPHEAAAYPPDVLADDGLALLAHLGLIDFDLGGYSLGGRTVVRMLARGVTPSRAVVAGMGLDGILRAAGSGETFRRILTNLGSFERGSPDWMAEAFLKTNGGDPIALLHIIDTAVDTSAEQISRMSAPALVVRGAQDAENVSARDLADLLPKGRYVEVPGTHMGAVTKPNLGLAIGEFLGHA
jgi:pimeloyl-ACP methyl ester carboxylesterase